MVDVPNERSSHREATLRGAGLGPATGVAVAIAVVIREDEPSGLVLAVLAGSLAMASVGLVEDVRGLSVRARLGLQVIAALTVACVLCVLADLPWWVAGPVAFAVVAFVNVTNFMDGIDGISAFYGVVAGAHFAVLGAAEGRDWLLVSGLVLAASFVAFVPWNLGRRRVFLGDVGSYLLGALVACTGAAFFLTGGSFVLAVAPTVLYLADTAFTLVARARRGEPVLQAHRSHVYQRLTQAGWSHPAVAGLVAVGTAACCLLAHVVSLGGIASVGGVLALGAVVTAYLAAPRLVGRSRTSRTTR